MHIIIPPFKLRSAIWKQCILAQSCRKFQHLSISMLLYIKCNTYDTHFIFMVKFWYRKSNIGPYIDQYYVLAKYEFYHFILSSNYLICHNWSHRDSTLWRDIFPFPSFILASSCFEAKFYSIVNYHHGVYYVIYMSCRNTSSITITTNKSLSFSYFFYKDYM